MQNGIRRFPLLVLSLSLLIFASSSWAQSSGTIEGVVKDPSGAAVPNATVEIHNPVSHFDRSTETDDEGKFTIKNVPAGKRTFQFWHESCGYVAKELKSGGKPLTWTKGKTDFTITPKGVDLGTVEIGAAAFKHR